VSEDPAWIGAVDVVVAVLFASAVAETVVVVVVIVVVVFVPGVAAGFVVVFLVVIADERVESHLRALIAAEDFKTNIAVKSKSQLFSGKTNYE